MAKRNTDQLQMSFGAIMEPPANPAETPSPTQPAQPKAPQPAPAPVPEPKPSNGPQPPPEDQSATPKEESSQAEPDEPRQELQEADEPKKETNRKAGRRTQTKTQPAPASAAPAETQTGNHHLPHTQGGTPGRTSSHSDAYRTVEALAESPAGTAIIDLDRTSTPGGWVSQDFALGLARALSQNRANDTVTINATKTQARTVLEHVQKITGISLKITPPEPSSGPQEA